MAHRCSSQAKWWQNTLLSVFIINSLCLKHSNLSPQPSDHGLGNTEHNIQQSYQTDAKIKYSNNFIFTLNRLTVDEMRGEQTTQFVSI